MACVALLFAITVMASRTVGAQTFTVIHNFTGAGDGGNPYAGLTIDAAGNLYGTTFYGGSSHWGTVFRLRHSGSTWVLIPLHSFAAGNDGYYPYSRVAIAADGTLYGTASVGGSGGGGTVFHLTPPPSAPKSVLAPWNLTVLYSFNGNDGSEPQGDLTFDPSRNIYGTTIFGGNANLGVIYELTPSGSNWTETVLYSPQNSSDPPGIFPYGGVIVDKSENFYGVFLQSGSKYAYWGIVYQLSPSGSGWTERIVHGFTNGDGTEPQGGLILDSSGNLFGSTSGGGTGYGTVFELTPGSGGWTFDALYGWNGGSGCGPTDKLVMDAAGSLYGTTFCDGAYGYGNVFKLTPGSGGWTYSSLHDFTGYGDGAFPLSGLVFDANGNLYGTATYGGTGQGCNLGCGVVFEIAP